ncbi:MAG: serine/threonine-protein kinase, partial [Calditrichia bacterium]
RIYASLKHPNIVTVFDFGTSGGIFFIAMEYVEGMNLAAFIRDYKPVPLQEALFIIREVLKALKYAHGKGVIHRDIKPTNIMIGHDGSIKLADFGLATQSGMPNITDENSSLGTPAYMSPEQARGEPLTARSDLFSLGVTFYEMLTGISPFYDSNLAVTIDRILNHKPARLQKLRPEIPVWLDTWTHHLLEKDRKKRTGSAAEAQEILAARREPLLQQTGLAEFIQNPAKARRNSLPAEHHKKKSRFRSVPFYLAAGALLALLFISGYFLIKNRDAAGGESASARSDSSQKINSMIFAEDSTAPDTAAHPQENKQPNKFEPQNSGISSKMKFKIPPETTRRSQPEKTIIDSPADRVAENDESSKIQSSEAISGGLFIICNPWAEVYIDNEYYQTTPLNQPISLAPGSYLVELRNPSNHNLQREVAVTAGKVDTLITRLKPAFGYLSLEVLPWAKVFIDNQYQETTPIREPLQLTPGSHIIRLENPGYSNLQDTLLIKAGETVVRQFNLQN